MLQSSEDISGVNKVTCQNCAQLQRQLDIYKTLEAERKEGAARGGRARTEAKRLAQLKNPSRAKLTAEDVRTIKSELKNGVSKRELACRFDVDRSTIQHIDSGHTWSHLDDSTSKAV